jgi:hypothetical protein
VTPTPTELPEVQPTDAATAAIWKTQLTTPANQVREAVHIHKRYFLNGASDRYILKGCGHMKLMMTYPSTLYGLPNATIPTVCNKCRYDLINQHVDIAPNLFCRRLSAPSSITTGPRLLEASSGPKSSSIYWKAIMQKGRSPSLRWRTFVPGWRRCFLILITPQMPRHLSLMHLLRTCSAQRF